MSVIVNAGQRDTKADAGGQFSSMIIAVGLVLFGLWFGFNKSVEFLHSRLHDPEEAIQAEMEYLQRRMDCLPGEMLQITPLPGGAKSVRCVPGPAMPRLQRLPEGGTRG